MNAILENILVSVIIPTYKRSPDIVKRALVSALSQTHANIEVFVVDDSPPDFSDRDSVRDTLEGLNDSRVRYIRHEKNMGACAARNTGITASSGEYVAFLDDDDEWLPEKLRLQLVKMANPSVGLVYCGRQVMDSRSNGVARGRSPFSASPNFYRGKVMDQLLCGNFIGSTSFSLIRKSCFDKCGMFDLEMQASQDYELYLRIALDFEVDYVEDILAYYYIHDGDQISDNPYKKLASILKIHEQYKEHIENNSYVYNSRLLLLSSLYASTAQLPTALKIWWEAVTVAPFNVRKNMRKLAVVFKNRLLYNARAGRKQTSFS